MSKRILLSLLTTLLLLASGLTAYARVPNAVRFPNGSSERDQDGLNGPVRRVRTETVKLTNKNGKLVEGQRVTLEVAAYDIKGAKVENLYYPVPGAAVTGKEVYKYDDKGNIIEMTLQDDKGALLSKETYSYEFDQFGNWVKMTTSVALVENGKITFEPTEITYRTISYYLDEAMLAKMSQPTTAPAAATTSAAGNAANTGAANTGAANNASNSNANAPATGNQPASNPKPVAQTPANDSSSASKQPSQPVAANNKPVTTSTDTAKQPTTQPTSAPASNTPAVVKTDVKATDKPAESKPAAEQSSASAPVVKPLLKPVSGGVLNGKALSLPKPIYPPAARSARMNGVVVVEVVIDVNGKVISARAVSGPGLLQQAAVQAAYQAKFSPTILSGQPVKVMGTINYNFAIAQ